MNNYRQASSVTSMMSQLGWEELRLRRARIKTILLFKIVNNLVDIPPEPFLIPTGAITRGHITRFLQPHTRTITMQYSFFPSAIRTWNTLHCTSATGQHDLPGGFPTGPGQHHHCTIELLLLFLIVYTGHFNCTWVGSFIVSYEQCDYTPGADLGFQVRGGGALKKIAPSEGRRENFWGITPKNHIFSNFRGGGGRRVRPPPPWIRPCTQP